jgi:hypothetical protein
MTNINKALFLQVFKLIFEAHKQGSNIFSEHTARTVGPQNIFRPANVGEGSVDHLYWLALVAFSDRRTNSTELYKNFAKMFKRNPTLFRRGCYPSVRRMTKLFRSYKIALPVMEIKFFIERKRHLDEYFDGNPLKIYEGCEDVSSLMEKLNQIAKENNIKNLFPGAKEKIFCLLAMFLREHADLKFADVVPVDVWVQSISASTGVIEGQGQIKFDALGHQLRPLIREAFSDYQNVDGSANATWILGKFGCTNCSRLDMTNKCPIYNLCKGPFERMRHPVSGKHLVAIQLPPKHKPKQQG